MMKHFRFLLLALVVVGLSSCDNITEEIYLEKDGSGTYEVYADMVPSMTKMAVQMAGLFGNDSTGKALDQDELIADILEDLPVKIDSTYSYEKEIDEDIRDSKVYEKYGERMNGFQRGGKDDGYMHMGMRFEFKNLAELTEVMEMMSENQKKGKDGELFSSLGASKAEYFYEKGKFWRKCTYDTQEELGSDDLGMLIMLLGDAYVQTVVHMPAKAIEAKGDHLVSNENGKVVYKYSFLDLVNGEVNSDFEIKVK